MKKNDQLKMTETVAEEQLNEMGTVMDEIDEILDNFNENLNELGLLMWKLIESGKLRTDNKSKKIYNTAEDQVSEIGGVMKKLDEEVLRKFRLNLSELSQILLKLINEENY